MADTKYTIMRGRVIDRASALEHAINVYIGRHFTTDEDKLADFVTLIMPSSRMIYENKRQIFKSLVEKKDQKFLEENSNVFADLNKIIDYRNIFAHYPAALLKNKGGEEEILFDIKKALTFKKFSEDEINEVYALIDHYLDVISVLADVKE